MQNPQRKALGVLCIVTRVLLPGDVVRNHTLHRLPIVIGLTTVAGRDALDQLLPARAVQRAGQVMQPPVRPLAGLFVRFEHRLDLGEGLDRNEPGVLAVELDTPPGHRSLRASSQIIRQRNG
jgi:hypothetical protein